MDFVDISNADFYDANESESFYIIYVDDVYSNLATFKRRLSSHHEVYTAENSEEMFNVMKNVTPDIIPLEINMPGVDDISSILKSIQKALGNNYIVNKI